ncbi:MAG: two pore domain potassium channel family protein [Betaproteobacteria bacterium]|nr:two pore domain potassium channel family protein [Betaproteobacteria bacterium]
MRRNFMAGLLVGLRVVWPILSALLAMMALVGLVVGMLEGWSVQESIYFSYVTGLTIGYGDLAPKTLLARTLAILIGACGILLTALIAAVAVKALTVARDDPSGPQEDDAR